MSGDYLIVSRPASAAADAQVAAGGQGLREGGWTRRLAAPGLEVWTRAGGSLPVERLAEPAAVLVGRSHLRLPGQPRSPRTRPGSDPAAWAADLCRRRWGAFIALAQDPRSGNWSAFRDPSGALEAFAWRSGELAMVGSGLDGVPGPLRPERLALDWDVIAQFVLRPWLAGTASPLEGVRVIAPGDLVSLSDAAGAVTPIWRPLDWIAADAGPEGAFAERLREVVIETVRALAAPHAVLAAEVSGGLDSAVVNAAVAASGLAGRVSAALHYYGDRADGDERVWAAQVCARWKLPLRCVPRRLEPFDPEADFAPLARDVRPPFAALDSWRDRQAAAELGRAGAGALLTGTGGDAVFFQMPTPLVLADLVRDQGVKAALDPLFTDLARRLRRSVWSVAAEALADARRSRAPALDLRFAGPRALAAAPGAPHPWLQDLERAPPAKRLQLISLAGLQTAQGRSRRSAAAELIHPLLAQPVVELCLAIPAYRHVPGGRERGLVRSAFHDLLPHAVTQRTSKGDLTSHFSRRAAASLEVLRPWLLDGALAAAGVLDRAAVDAALDADSLIQRPDGLSLVSAAALEAWVRWWQGRAPDSSHAPRHRA